MKSKCWLILSFLSLQFHSTAQTDFAAGIIVLNNNDTLNVLVKKISGRISPHFIQYKTTASPEIISLSAAQVKWFYYRDGEWYFGYVGPVETSSLSDNSLTYDTALHTIVDTTFIRAVIISKASLFYGRDHNDRIHLFYSKDQSAITELVYKKYYVDEVVVADYQNKITKRAIMANEIYKGQLIKAFEDCPYVSTGILSRSMSYAKNDLLKLFKDYNSCKDTKIEYEESVDKGKVEFSFLAGLNYTGLKIGSSIPQWESVNFDHGLGWEAGIALNWFPPHLEKKFSIYNELLIKEHSLNAQVGESTTQTGVYQAAYIKLITTGRYSIYKDNVRVFFEAGFSNGFAIGHTVTSTDGVINTMFLSYRNYEQGLLAGGGLSLKKISGEFRFERSNGFSEFSDYKTAFTTLYLLFGYTL